MTSGVYSIRNKNNNDVYIGSSRDVAARLKRHVNLLEKGNHHSRHLQNAWNYYGKDSFEFSVLEECAIENLIQVEQNHIDKYSPAYNVSPVAGRTAGITRSEEYIKKQKKSQSGKSLSEDTRRKISEGMKGKQNSLGVKRIVKQETREKISSTLLGHPVSEDTRIKLSQKNKGYKHTEEAKIKIGAASLGNKHASRKQSDEEKKKRSDALLESYRRKRENAGQQPGN